MPRSGSRSDLIVAGLGLARNAALRPWCFLGRGLGGVAVVRRADRRRQKVERDPLVVLIFGPVGTVAVTAGRALIVVPLIAVVATIATRAIATVTAVAPLTLVAARAIVIVAAPLLLFALLLVGSLEHVLVAVALVGVVIVTRPRALLFKASPAFAENPEIMIGELQIIFGLHAVTGELGVTRHALVLFEQLRGIATLAVILPVTRLTAHSLGTLPAATAPAAAALSIIDQNAYFPTKAEACPFGLREQTGAYAPA
jgi:hypothetical protein